jgi:hypothetical protein
MANSVHSIHEKKNHHYLYSLVKNASHNAYHVICNDSFTPCTMIASSSDLMGVELGTMLLMLFLMLLRTRMHLMDLQFYLSLLMHPM